MEQRKQIEKCFCYEGKIVLIKGKEVEEVPYCKIRFLRILNNLWQRKKHFYQTADMLIKATIEEYVGAKLLKSYKGKILSDDKFYIKFRNLVKEKYAEKFLQNQKKRHETLECRRAYQIERTMFLEVRYARLKRYGAVVKAL